MAVKQLLLTTLLVTVLAAPVVAADGDWERLADGSLGQKTSFRGAGDLVIPAYLRKPKDQGPFPVVVMLQGGRYRKGVSAAMGSSLKAPVADFIRAGWAVYCTDYRPNDKISIALIETDDALEAIKSVRKLPDIDPGRVVLWGASHSANVSSRVIARADLYGAILCAPAAMDLIEVKKADGCGEPVLKAIRLGRKNARPAPPLADKDGKIVVLADGGWAKAPPGRVGGPGNSELYSFETAFAVKWLIERQLQGDAELNYDPKKAALKAPWLNWGPYLWANGTNKRKDGFSSQPSDFRDNDRMHHSAQGQAKMGRQLLQFFKTDTTTRSWFVK